MESAKLLVHQITNKMSAVLGYIELTQYQKAKEEALQANALLEQLRNQIITLQQLVDDASKKLS